MLDRRAQVGKWIIAVGTILLGILSANCRHDATADYAVSAVPFTQVNIDDEFWSPKQEVNRTVSIRHAFQQSEQRGRDGSMNLFEAAAAMIATRNDPEFEQFIKERVDRIVKGAAASQGAVGRSARVRRSSAEAAVAYYEATGDRRLLDMAIESADATHETYGPAPKRGYISGHEGQKIDLIKLFRFTENEKYWMLAKFLLDIRGRAEYQDQTSSEYPGEREYNQNHKPVLEQDEAVGHAVRAMYLYIPLTDIAALTGQSEYAEAADQLWTDVVSKKMYITGGIGSIMQQEKFGAAYELPNLSAYCETCAARGLFVWNQRQFRLHPDAKYIDVMERILFNGLLGAVSLSGDRFFYPNPLLSYGNYERSVWFNVPCCPPNLIRALASLGSDIYAQTRDEIFVNLFVGNRATMNLEHTSVNLTQRTRYPWEGQVDITVDPETSAKFSVLVRIPGWALNRPVPSDLYEYLDPTDKEPELRINNRPAKLRIEKGYVRIRRKWNSGDVIQLNLPMPVHRVLAHSQVKDDIGRVALERGPLVYCAEWPDNDGNVLNLVVADDSRLTAEFRPNLLNGANVITGKVSALSRGDDGYSVQVKPHDLVAIPYYAWANRGMGEMAVWLARSSDAARVEPVLAKPLNRVSSFGGLVEGFVDGYNRVNCICAVYDNVEPLHSRDESHLYYRMFPPKGESAWIEYEYEVPTEVSSAEVYFVDDERFCRLPQSWRILYKTGSEWKPVRNGNAYGIEKDRFNVVTFHPVVTRGIRLEIEPQTIVYKARTVGPPNAMTVSEDTVWREFGILEWRVK